MDTHSAFAGHDGTDAGTRAASIKTGLGDECIEWFDVVVGQTLNFQSQTSREGNFPITEFLSSFLFPVEHTNRSFSMPRELLMDQMRTAGLWERLRLLNRIFSTKEYEAFAAVAEAMGCPSHSHEAASSAGQR